MSEFLNVTTRALDDIYRVAKQLGYLSNAHFATGNTHLGEKMEEYAEKLNVCENEIRKEIRRKITDDLKEAEQSARNTVEAVLAARDREINGDKDGS